MKWKDEWKSVENGEPLLPGPLKLQQARGFYDDNSRTLSSVTRQLGFAGIAIVWIFHASSTNKLTIPSNLRIPSLLFVATLGCDLLQYVASTLWWGSFQRRMERKFQHDNLDETTFTFGAPDSINWIGNGFLVAKVVLLIVSYGWLLFALYQELFG